MRQLGQQLGVDPMSLYNHVRDKDDLLDGMVDVVVGEIGPLIVPGSWLEGRRRDDDPVRPGDDAPPPVGGADDRVAGRHRVRRRCATWTNVWGCSGTGGFSLELTHHALHVLGSRVFGFNQDLFDRLGVPASDPAATAAMTAAIAEQMATSFPNVAELAAAVSHDGGLGACDDDVEFAFALDLILDGLERLRNAA